MKNKIEKVIKERIQPTLSLHGGGIEFVGLPDDYIVKVKLAGACSTCPGRQQTIEHFVEMTFKEMIPNVRKVMIDKQVDDDLVTQALHILRSGR